MATEEQEKRVASFVLAFSNRYTQGHQFGFEREFVREALIPEESRYATAIDFYRAYMEQIEDFLNAYEMIWGTKLNLQHPRYRTAMMLLAQLFAELQNETNILRIKKTI